MTNELSIRRDEAKGKIYSHVRKKWLVETPEETVRQHYLLVLVNEYGFALEQIAEEMELTGRGSASARADFVLWRSAADKAAANAPFIIVECKSDSVTIRPQDYSQGENYARICGAPFFVTHNSRETRYWRVKKDKVPGYTEEIENIPHGDASDKDIEELLAKLRVFKEREFADLLHQCHNVIRNREKKDPAAAFDEIAKVLFIKVYVERQLLTRRSRENLFTVEVLNRQIAENPLDNLFQQTKRAYAADKIFEEDERINLKPATGEEIVRKLEKYNLSDTSEDVKGVAFERFLGRTFRGEIGQFFTPRTIVEFMVHMIDPQEGETVCDPASGSGGFLIRVFEIVREKILAAADQEYSTFKAETEADSSLSPELRAKLLQNKFNDLRAAVDQQRKDSRLWRLSNRCIYGTDANDRMARTSKMNMIMHGDGHGGVHHHDGFLNVNGIFEGRFDIILTNPPFGANVEPSDKVLEENLAVSPEAAKRYFEEYGDLYTEAQNRVKAALNKPIASLFDLPKSDTAKIKTEVLFIERCLDLLKPGGRLGIVLPEGIFNNPSLAYVREFAENRAFIRAVVSLPQETFVSSGASVKCSLLFLQKFTEAEQQRFDAALAAAHAEAAAQDAETTAAEQARLETAIQEAKAARDTERRKALQKELKDLLSQAEARQAAAARRMLKERLDYPIFMYEAEKVGITATGEEDQNELYPNPNQPADCAKTCLEWHREFKADAEKFGSGTEGRQFFFAVRFSELESWSVAAQFSSSWNWPDDCIAPLSSILARRNESALDVLTPETTVNLLTIRFDGSIEPREPVQIKDIKGRLFRVYPGDVVFSKIDVRNGAIGLAPADIDCMCVTAEFPVYSVNAEKAHPEYVKLLFRTDAFKNLLNSMISGASGRKRIQPSQLEKVKVPVPPLPVQRKIVEYWEMAQDERIAEETALSDLIAELNSYLINKTNSFKETTSSKVFIANFATIQQWDVKAGRASAFLSANRKNFVRLGDFTEECAETVKPWNAPEKDWPVYGVNNKEGVFLNGKQPGGEFNAAYKIIRKDWFFHNPTRANVGSLGIVPEVPDDAVTSPEYQVWRLKCGFLPEFMALMLRTEYFLALVAFNRVGGVKQRMYYSNLAEIRLPAIPDEVQINFSERRSNILAALSSAKRRLIQRGKEIEQMILGTVQL